MESDFDAFARVLAKSPTPIDQRKVDENRGFWAGALWAVGKLPNNLSTRWKQFVAEGGDE